MPRPLHHSKNLARHPTGCVGSDFKRQRLHLSPCPTSAAWRTSSSSSAITMLLLPHKPPPTCLPLLRHHTCQHLSRPPPLIWQASSVPCSKVTRCRPLLLRLSFLRNFQPNNYRQCLMVQCHPTSTYNRSCKALDLVTSRRRLLDFRHTHSCHQRNSRTLLVPKRNSNRSTTDNPMAA